MVNSSAVSQDQFKAILFLQLLKIIFDEEVSSDEIEMLRKHIIRLRYPVSIMTSFAFTGHAILPGAQNVKVKEKNATLK